ncbi:MAG: peptidylprolyl isomerase [Pseudomonadota bacterium]
MKKRSLFSVIAVLFVHALLLEKVTAGSVVEDQGVALSSDELAFIVESWTPDMREAALRDGGDRVELLNMALASKKLASQALDVDPQSDPEGYWRLQLGIRNLQSQFVVRRYLGSLDIPDMSELAAERYETQKDLFALVPEQRYSSHLILLCPAGGDCDRDARRGEAAAILAELEAGADFKELVAKYSEDPRSKDSGGVFDQWLELGQPNVDPYYIGAVFEIDEVGGHSQVVDTKFGLHIVQLDDLRPEHYKPFDEVKDNIVGALTKQYIELAAKEFDARFRFSEDVVIDDAAVEEILMQYNAPGAVSKQ